MKKGERRAASEYSAFIDLVGTRYYAQQAIGDPDLGDRYWSTRNKFHNAIGEHCVQLRSGKVYLFSDCAYVRSTDVRSLCAFLSELRTALAKDGLYFKGAVAAVPLAAKAATEFPFYRRETREKIGEVLQGYYFGRDAGTLFGLEESLKGIGIGVHSTGISAAVTLRANIRETVDPLDFSVQGGEARTS